MTAICRLRLCPKTRAYAARRKAEGLSKREIIRCLKRYIARETYQLLTAKRPLDKHESVRGSQYTSLAFGKTIEQAGVLPSMGRRGDAFDNAVAESFFATLETELLDRHTFRSRDQARLAVFTFIEGFYNSRRRHSTLGQRSPDRFEETMMKEDTQAAVAVSN